MQATPAYVQLSSTASGAFNDISSSVTLSTNPGNIIRFNERGLYRITYKSGKINMKVPNICAAIGNTWYARTDFEKRTAADATWRPIANNTNSMSIGALSLTDILPLGIDPGVSNAITHTAVFEPGDEIRVKFYGNLNMVTGGCSMLWSTVIGNGNDMRYTLDSTGAAATEIIVEKINS